MLECAFLKQKVLIIIVNMNHRSLGKNYNAGHHGNSRIEYNLLYFIIIMHGLLIRQCAIITVYYNLLLLLVAFVNWFLQSGISNITIIRGILVQVRFLLELLRHIKSSFSYSIFYFSCFACVSNAFKTIFFYKKHPLLSVFELKRT